MKLKFCFLILFVSVGILPIYSQNFSVPEINSFLKLKYKKLDSILISKGYTISGADSSKDFKIVAYINSYINNDTVYTRSFIAGYDFKSKSTDITFRISNKSEADNIIKWLEQNGYKLKTSLIDDIGGKTSEKSVAYKSTKQTIAFKATKKTVNGQLITYYQFEFSTLF